jgi:ATP-dependent RNA helicase MSS116
MTHRRHARDSRGTTRSQFIFLFFLLALLASTMMTMRQLRSPSTLVVTRLMARRVGATGTSLNLPLLSINGPRSHLHSVAAGSNGPVRPLIPDWFPRQERILVQSFATDAKEENVESVVWGRFDSLSPPLNEKLLSVVTNQLGFQQATEIQAKAWSAAVEGRDVLARARTGTGKTLAFLLPTLQRLAEKPPSEESMVQALILAPTRELALQIDAQIKALNTSLSHLTLFGGIPKVRDLRSLSQQVPDIVVATPGRLADHIKDTVVNGLSFRKMLRNIDILILDEADRYMDMGQDVDVIMSALPRNRQTLLFSATLPESVLSFLHQSMRSDFEMVDCIHDTSTETCEIVDQSHVIVKDIISDTVEIIRHIMDTCQDAKIIVFFPTTAMVSYFAKLFNFGIGGKYVLEISSKKTQAYRTSVSDRFRELRKGVLFSSDVSARGVDYPGITHVIQVGLPSSKEAYIHRLGRTGRAGNSGHGILILNDIEKGFLDILDGMDVPANYDLKSIISDTGASPSAVRQQLDRVLESVKSGDNETLVVAAKTSYRSILGYYNGKLKNVGVKGLDNLVEFCNECALQMGLKTIPPLNFKTATNMGLDRVAGIVLEEPTHKGRPHHSREISYRQHSIIERGDYDSWGSSVSPSRSRSSHRSRSTRSTKRY